MNFKDARVDCVDVEAFIQQSCLSLVKAGVACKHTIVKLIEFIEHQPNPAKIYRNIILKSNSMWGTQSSTDQFIALFCSYAPPYVFQQDLLKQLFEIYCAQNQRVFVLNAFLTSMANPDKVLYRIVISRYCQEIVDSQHFKQFLIECPSLVRYKKLSRMFTWKLIKILVGFMDKNHKEVLKNLVNALIKDIKVGNLNMKVIDFFTKINAIAI